MKPCGCVFLVGAGPGDPGLVTLRAKQLISECDVLVCDHLVNAEIKSWARHDCEVIDMGKGPDLEEPASQQEIHEILVDRAGQGLRVVRLKGGDPFVFARGGEEVKELAEAEIPFEIVPGVTAALAAAGYAGIPLTHRELSSCLVFLTGHEDPAKESFRVDFQHFAQRGGTLCIYMGMRRLPKIVASLLEGGLDPKTPSCVIQWATTPKQRSVRAPLEQLCQKVEDAGVGSPAIIVIGTVAGSPLSWDWFSRRPLLGKRVVITRSQRQVGSLRDRLTGLGAEVMEIPLIEVRPGVEREVIAEVFAELWSYEWIVFTSRNGVRFFFELFFKAFQDIRAFGGMRIAAIGAATAREIEQYHLNVELLPKESIAESLVDGMLATDSLPSSKVLVVAGNLNRDVLVRRLEEEGEAIVDVLKVYETVPTDLSHSPEAERYRREGADFVAFTSSSTARNYASQAEHLKLGRGARKPQFCSIGPITSDTMREVRLPVDIEAKSHDLDGLVEAILERALADG